MGRGDCLKDSGQHEPGRECNQGKIVDRERQPEQIKMRNRQENCRDCTSGDPETNFRRSDAAKADLEYAGCEANRQGNHRHDIVAYQRKQSTPEMRHRRKSYAQRDENHGEAVDRVIKKKTILRSFYPSVTREGSIHAVPQPIGGQSNSGQPQETGVQVGKAASHESDYRAKQAKPGQKVGSYP